MASKELITKIVLKARTDPSLSKAFSEASKHSDTYMGNLSKIGDVAVKAFKIVGTAVAAAGVACGKAAIDFESAFAGVKKTVDETSTTSYEDLSKGIREMSKTTPAAATEIAAVAEAAGQLGIKADDILTFSKVMIDLGESTNLTSDEAATSIAKLFNVTGTSMDKVSNFGSTLVALGNNAATTESDILAMSSRIAGSGKQIGLTEQQILALATSLSSVGIEAEMGGSAISTTMTQIDKDVALNSEALGIWAKTAGMSTAQFSKAWGKDAYGTLQKVLQGMASTKDEGGNLNVLLEDLGINGIRQGDMLKRLSSATGLMSEMTDLANKSWSENSALSKEANTRYATMASKLEILKNTVVDAAITIGNKLMPYLDKLVTAIQKIDFEAVAEKIGRGIDWIAEHADTLAAIASVIAGAFVGIKIAGFIKGIMTAIQIISAMVKTFGVLKVVLATLGGPVTIIITLVGALVAGFIYLWNNCEGFRNFWIGLWDKLKSAALIAGNWLKNFFTVTIPAAFAKVVEFIKANWKALLLMLVNPFAGIFKLLYDNCEGFRNIVNKVIEWIKNAFNSVVQWFAQLPSKIGAWLSGVWQSVTAWGANLWAKAKEIGRNFLNGVVNFFQQLPYRLGYIIGFAIGKVILFGQKLWNFATVTIPQFIVKVGEWFAQLPSRIWTWLVNAWNKVSTWGANLWAKAKEIGSKFLNSVVTFFKQLPSRVWTWLSNTASKVATWGANLWVKAKQIGSNVLNAVVNFFAQLPSKVWTWLSNTANKVIKWGSDMVSKAKKAAMNTLNAIVNTFKNLPSKMAEIGKNIVQGLWNGLKNAKKWLIDKVKSFSSGIVDGIKGALGINSPSVVMEKLFKWVPVGAGNGILDNAKYAINAVKSMGGKITTAASKISPTFGSASLSMEKFGTGGTVTSPRAAIVGDKPETIVPHGNTARNRALLSEAARGVGVSTGGNVINFTFSPVINGSNVEENRAMLQDEEERFEQRMNAWLAKNGRLAFS